MPTRARKEFDEELQRWLAEVQAEQAAREAEAEQ